MAKFKVDAGSAIVGVVIGAGALLLFDYLFYTEGGLLSTQPGTVTY